MRSSIQLTKPQNSAVRQTKHENITVYLNLVFTQVRQWKTGELDPNQQYNIPCMDHFKHKYALHVPPQVKKIGCRRSRGRFF